VLLRIVVARPGHHNFRGIINIPELTAKTFCESFLRAHDKARAAFTKDRWKEIWNSHRRELWNALMLWQPTPTFRPPEEIERSVLAETASDLGLEYGNGEPLRLDAVFVSKQQETWSPMLVAIEHENDCREFELEVRKLLSVRCQLKVGITYIFKSTAKRLRNPEYIRHIIGEEWAKISSVIGEDQKTEYLFLVGIEVPERQVELSWYAITFRGCEGTQKRTFEGATQI